MADSPIAESDRSACIGFGRFTVWPLRREVLADGRPVELGGRAFDVLIALIEARGTVLSRDELMSRVWPGRIIEENSLEAQISALRKALGPDRDLIRTVAGRGYQFTGEIGGAAAAEAVAPPPPSTNLPELVSELIGRDAEVGEVAELAKAHRLITLVGAGGVGKTRLSFEVARQLLPQFADGVWVAELGPLSDPELVPVTVATALRLTLASDAPSPETVASLLGTKRILLLLDNCEHVIEAAARLAEALLRADPHACVLATSREPLRVSGEVVYRVPSLQVPAEGTHDEDQLLRTGAVRLFVVRARAAEPHFSPEQRVAVMAAICRQLDGIPLAIELAAARTAVLGVEGLAARLDDRFSVLTGGHRTALPRHQTLQATLDWSYELLLESERLVLRRLAVFVGGFTLKSATAVAVAAEADISAADVIDCITNLVAKSLLTATVGGLPAQYRLLQTTRAYALDQLTERGELQALSRRHAEYFRDMFETAAAEWETRPRADWLGAYGHQLDNVRAALDWAFSPHGDAEIGVALTVAAVPLWFELSLVTECSARAEQALSSRAHEADRATRRDMQLYAGLAGALLYAKGRSEKGNAAWTKALEIAERLDDIDYRLRALWGLWAYCLNGGEYRNALALAKEFSRVAASKGDSGDALVGDRLMGRSLHYLGEHGSARRHLERMLGLYAAPAQRSDVIRFQADQRVMAGSTLANILWLQGFPDQAMRTARSAVGDAQAIDHTISLCNVLGDAACPIALLNGDLTAAKPFVEMLLAHSANRMLAHLRGLCLEGTMLLKRGDVEAGLQRLSSAVHQLRERKLVGLPFNAFFADLAQALGRSGQAAEGLVIIGEALERCEVNEERWCTAELLRIKGELLLAQGAADAATAAEKLFQQGLDWAGRQGALSWELRCATSLAQLWHKQGLTSQARELLGTVYGRFSEGFGTADLTAARALLDSLHDGP